MAAFLETHSPKGTGLAIFGAGASGREVAWLAQQCWGGDLRLTFLVDRDDLVGSTQNGVPVVHVLDFAKRSPQTPVVVAVGDPGKRKRCADLCSQAGLEFASLVHPRVETSHWVTIGKGTIVCAGSILTTNIQIGDHVHVNIDCAISHDAIVGDFATLSPGVNISGWVTIGCGAFLGTGSIVVNGSAHRPLVVGENAIIGAGACVIGDVDPNSTVVGVPAADRAQRR